MAIPATFLFCLSALASFGHTPPIALPVPPDSIQVPPIGKTPPRPVTRVFSDKVFHKNIVKLNLSSLALYNNSLSYERVLSKKTTLVLGYRYMPKTTATSALVVRKAAAFLRENHTSLEDDLNATMVGNNTFTGEVRFYGGKKPGARGFYLSLYGRYMRVDASYPYRYETDTRIYTLPLEGQLSGFAAGVMIGSQWLIAKRVAFDWYILGGHYGQLKIDARADAELKSMSRTEKNSLAKDLESLGHELPIKPNSTATVTDQGARIEGSVPFIGIRSLGFNLGIAF